MYIYEPLKSLQYERKPYGTLINVNATILLTNGKYMGRSYPESINIRHWWDPGEVCANCLLWKNKNAIHCVRGSVALRCDAWNLRKRRLFIVSKLVVRMLNVGRVPSLMRMHFLVVHVEAM